MKHIQTVNRARLEATAKKGGCGKCQASCQSACKTSCTVGIRSVPMRRTSKVAIRILVCSAENARVTEHTVTSNQVKNLIRNIRNTKQQT